MWAGLVWVRMEKRGEGECVFRDIRDIQNF